MKTLIQKIVMLVVALTLVTGVSAQTKKTTTTKAKTTTTAKKPTTSTAKKPAATTAKKSTTTSTAKKSTATTAKKTTTTAKKSTTSTTSRAANGNNEAPATTRSSQSYSRSSSTSTSSSSTPRLGSNFELPRFHARVQAGLGFNFSNAEDATALAYPAFNFTFDFRLAPIPLYLETGVGLMWKGYSQKYSGYFGDETDSEEAALIYLPLLLSYHHYLTPKMAIQPFIGGFVGGLIEDVEVDDVEDSGFSYGIRLGCGFNWKRLYTNIGYDIDLNKTWFDEDNDRYINTGTLFVTVGFNMGGDH